MSDQFLRKAVVFNKKSVWHMEILRRIENESKNFSGYVLSILKGHFDDMEELEKQAEKPVEKKKEQLHSATKIVFNGKVIEPIYKGNEEKFFEN